MFYLFGGFLLILTTAVVFATTRTAQLKRMARRFNLRYQRHVASPLTPSSTKEMKFFSRGFHRFFQVLTWEDQGAFIRACEDRVYVSPSATFPQVSYTLWTAELIRGTFVPFILIPRSCGQFPKEAVFPPELAKRYALIAPQNYQLPIKLIDLLKDGPDCYVEATLYSLVYHEYKIVPVSQIPQIHSRVKMFIKQLANSPKQVLGNSFHASLTAEQLQTSAMLTLQQSSGTKVMISSTLRLFYVIVAFLIITGLLLTARYFLQTLAR